MRISPLISCNTACNRYGFVAGPGIAGLLFAGRDVPGPLFASQSIASNQKLNNDHVYDSIPRMAWKCGKNVSLCTTQAGTPSCTHPL